MKGIIKIHFNINAIVFLNDFGNYNCNNIFVHKSYTNDF
jgi:hypothetical protein